MGRQNDGGDSQKFYSFNDLSPNSALTRRHVIRRRSAPTIFVKYRSTTKTTTVMGTILRAAVLFALTGVAVAQFGEIASIVTGLLGSGGGGLAGLAGSSGGLASLAGSGASAGAGAASSALSGVGPLYQLAQAALQLTGTGVGIANQASESAWFPVAVENAARMNRDFQERLLKGAPPPSGGLGGGAGLGELGGSSSKTSGGKISTEYGKNFESGETETTDYDGSSGGRGGKNGVTPTAQRVIRPTTAPDFAGVEGGDENSSNGASNSHWTNSVEGANSGASFPSPSRLPGFVSLLPGESTVSRRVTSAHSRSGTSGLGENLEKLPSPSNRIGVGSVQPLGPQALHSTSSSVGFAAESGEVANNRPKINIEIPHSTAESFESIPPRTSSVERSIIGRPTLEAHKSGGASGGVQINYDYNESGGGDDNNNEGKFARTKQQRLLKRPNIDFSIDAGDNAHNRPAESDKAGDDNELLAAVGIRSKNTLPVHNITPPRASSPNKAGRREQVESDEEDKTEVAMRAAKAMAQMIAAEFESEQKVPQMVPELQKLIGALKSSNLSREEFIEIAKQLEINKDPRVNTTPTPEHVAARDDKTEESDEETKRHGGGRKLKVRNDKRDRATLRNLEALRGALQAAASAEFDDADPVLRNVEAAGSDRPPPVVLMLPRHQHTATGTTDAKSNFENATVQRPKVHAVIPYPRRIVSAQNLSALSQNAGKEQLLEKVPAVVTNSETPLRITGATENAADKLTADASAVSATTPAAAHSHGISTSTPVQITGPNFIQSRETPPAQQLAQQAAYNQKAQQLPQQWQQHTTFSSHSQTQTQQPVVQQQFQHQQPDIFRQHQQQTYNDLYRNYINFYYPQYAAQYYGTHNVYGQQQQQPQQSYHTYQHATQTYSPQQQHYYPQQQQQQQQQPWSHQQQQNQRSLPSRTVPEAVVTTPPSALQHPFSQGALLTLMQPYHAQPFGWQFGR